MNGSFDPYYHWLGIPPGEQPPNHYRLLGVAEFERDPEVIQNAADRQMMHLRTFQSGPRAADSQRLLNEVAAARICLLNAERKKEYDRLLFAEQYERATAALQAQTAAAPAAGQPPQPAPAGAMPLPAAAQIATTSAAAAPARRAGKRRKGKTSGSARQIVGVVAGGVAGCAIALTILWYAFEIDPLGVMEKYAPGGRPRAVANLSPAPNETERPTEAETPVAANPVTASKAPVTTPKKPAVTPVKPSGANSPPAATTAPPPPAPPPPGNPFARLAPAPAIGLIGGPFELGAVDPRAAERWEVALFGGFADVGEQYELAMSAGVSADPRDVGWPIHLRPRASAEDSGDAAPGGDATIARLFLEDDRLKFAWVDDEAAALRPQVLNAVITLSEGQHRRVLFLRKPEARGAVVLDLAQKVNALPLQVPALPAQETLSLHVGRLDQFPPGTNIPPDETKLRVGDRLSIEISTGTEAGAEIDVQFIAAGETPELRLRGWYRLSNRREEFTTEHVSREYAKLQKILADDQRELTGAQAALVNIDSSLRTLAGRRPSTQAEKANLLRQIGALQSQRGKAAGIIRRTSTSIPRTQAAVQQLDAVAKLGGQLHNKARLHLRLAAEIDGRELPLLQLGQVGPQQALRSPRVPAAHVGHMRLMEPMGLTGLTASDWPLGAIGLK